MLPQEAITEFKELYRKRYGVDLSDEEASFRANNLVGLYKAVYGQPPTGRHQDAKAGRKGPDAHQKGGQTPISTTK